MYLDKLHMSRMGKMYTSFLDFFSSFSDFLASFFDFSFFEPSWKQRISENEKQNENTKFTWDSTIEEIEYNGANH